MALHLAQAILMTVNLIFPASMLRQRVQVIVWYPAGSACPDTGTSSYIPCPLGRYNSFAGATNCSACPQGKYGPYRGSTICLNCPKGSSDLVMVALLLMSARHPAGKFSSVDGLYSCTLCSKSNISPRKTAFVS